jgi:cytidylate kinase
VPASIIAIDGPAASGKSAIGSMLADRLGYRFLDTGAMYRALTWLAIRNGVDVHDETALADLAQRARLEARDAPPGSAERTSVIVEGEDATPHLRDATVEAAVSFVSRVPAVRQALVPVQRTLAVSGRVVMAGRDIGTVLQRRDGIDSAREESPLTAAPGAVIINTDDLNIEEVVRRIEALVRG